MGVACSTCSTKSRHAVIIPRHQPKKNTKNATDPLFRCCFSAALNAVSDREAEHAVSRIWSWTLKVYPPDISGMIFYDIQSRSVVQVRVGSTWVTAPFRKRAS